MEKPGTCGLMALVKGRDCEVLEYKEWIMMLYREAMVHHGHNLFIIPCN